MNVPSAATVPPSLLRRCAGFAMSLAALHATVTASLIPILGVHSLLYAVLPPVAAVILVDDMRTAPLFAMLVSGTVLCLWFGLRGPLAAVGGSLPRRAKWMLWAVLAVWLPTLCGESVRWALMRTTLAQADTACHGTRTLVASVRDHYSLDFEVFREPHAWLIRGGEAWLWSYRTLRFEHAPGWHRARALAEDCGARR